jgi:hypothetical protein
MSGNVSSKRNVVIAATGVTALTAAVCAIVFYPRAEDADLPKELRLASLQKKAAEEPVQVRDTVRGAFQRGDLTDEQRRQVRENVRQVFMDEMNKRMDEYFTADASQKNAVLDRHLDEFVKRMNEMRQRRERERREGGDQRAAGDRRGGGERGFRGPRGPNGERRRPTQQQRKRWSESRDPDTRARFMAYFTAMRKRAQERGIELPGPPRRGRR